MIWVVSSEIIPETHSQGHQNAATTPLMIGLVLMLFLDWTLG
jgi:ZIP family zinc transporter